MAESPAYSFTSIVPKPVNLVGGKDVLTNHTTFMASFIEDLHFREMVRTGE